MPFVWDEKYRLGIPEIDRQHQTLLLLLNKAFDFYSPQNQQQATEDLRRRVLKDLANLREIARAHFATEADLMERYDYPDLAQHLEEHGKFMEIVARLEKKTPPLRSSAPMSGLMSCCSGITITCSMWTAPWVIFSATIKNPKPLLFTRLGQAKKYAWA